MRTYTSLILIAVIFCCSTAGAQPAIIPRVGTAPHDPARTYTIVKDYLSDPYNGLFTIARMDSARHLVVAKRSGIGSHTWSDWAYCKLGPNQMLDTLEDGTVTLTVEITPGGRKFSYVRVTADFKGTYGLAGNETTAQCISKGVLENRILQAVGATPQT
jgi:hypothetical protein